ncbi:MAG TPA: ATP-binding cassette domain-containing protein [Geminicoccus sp.]|jgi:simple sugar transport system ATP-binding protein|uniref:ATP-binding cassette domain-containing protein n=1 Tax=Geminicoccus sp. TaxID=2024832 RepID=UPI002E30DF8C|nr:ATP-binding cassette domain-containing protein [Geminicoccus sp.]HEX2525965.1 ATP-binding cassette domain-containing protein [Geminicoccus sp.]
MTTVHLEERHQDAAGFVKPSPQALVRCEGLEKWYGGVHALKAVDFHAEPGEIVGLVGDNGAGKSTLIKLLSGVHRPDSGRIFIEGKEVALTSPKAAMALGIETIYQYTAMVPAMSIARNMFIGREPLKWSLLGLGWMDGRAMAETAIRSLTNIDLRTRSPDTPVEELSGGQRQAVAIARAMYFKSKMLILDEPTNHLSVKETNKVLDYVQELKGQGITSIFISHNLHHVHPIADRIVAMARGEKIADVRKSDISLEEMTEMIV